MSLRGWTMAAVLGVIATEVAACGLTGLPVRTSSMGEMSLAQIRVTGYQKTGEFADAEPGTTNSSAVYVGPPISNSGLTGVVNGPGVTMTIFPRPSPHIIVLPTDNTVWIGRGHAPLNCGLLIYAYRKGKRPDDWWNITNLQLAQARMGRLSIFEITVGCGKG